MALKLALPLFGLEPEHFSSLSAKLLCDQNLRNLSDSGRDSPSAGSDSSGVSSLIGESTISESTPISSRPETPNEVSCKSQERREEKTNASVRVVYGERDILNLGANIRKPFWQVKDPEWFPFDDDNFMVSRSMCHGPYNQTFIGNYSTKRCSDCGFGEPSPYLF